MRSVFVTGATGTIGSVLVPRLLADESTSLTLLLRARDDAELRTRLARMLAYWGLQSGERSALRIRPLLGDMTLPRFGLDEAGFSALAAETTHVIHSAASVKLNMSVDEARATAVTPTRTVLELGRRAQRSGTLRKIELVSTVGVWGRTPGLMPERPLPEVSDFHNTYEAAKAEAERVVWSEGAGLPITVHRPSMVVGESGTGRVIHFQVFYHLCEFLSGVRTFGVMPRLGHTRLDTVPVDWVADAICWASAHQPTVGRIFHLCSGAREAITLPRLQERVRQAWKEAGRSLPRLRMVDRYWLERLVPLIGTLAGARARRALRGLPPVLAYLAEDQGFGNTDSAATFTGAGLPLPPVESYLGPVLGYYLARQATRAAS
jgi:thioester reductase-like protein